MARLPSRTRRQTLFAKIRRKPDRLRLAADLKSLLDVENQEMRHRADSINRSIALRHHVNVRNAFEPFPDSFPTGRDFEVRVAGPAIVREKVFRGDAEKRRLHRAGRDFERLHEKRANGHRHRHRHENDFDIFAAGGVRIGFEPLVGGKVQFVHLDPNPAFVRSLRDGRLQPVQREG